MAADKTDSTLFQQPGLVRSLPSSFAGSPAAEGPGAAVTGPLQLERPPSGRDFNPLPAVEYLINDKGKKLCDANPNRISIMIRAIETATPNAVVNIFGSGGPPADPGSRLFPISVGEAFTLDITGEVWGWVDGATNIKVAVAEVNGPAQRS